ncbi:D(2) dopamine receptor A isoform X2 [Coccinella septempunctata]|uniref:D(2) dopamine receptor A isoform X2 n=1 Tax=Coccinella septempunctata TaxID=41139 RepID=UPI001D098A2F|nr:D(2) dopamine receptor A isoform X2 [Coccinella septempunctata]
MVWPKMSEGKVFHTATILLYNVTRKQPPINSTNRTALEDEDQNNWWALSALILAAGTAAGNILVCLAICWERRLQNVTNYFLMSLAITDLMVAILVMPLGILTLVRGYFPLPSIYCLAWICLDVLFCTASIMHLCTISVDRYLSLRYPMKFGRNKSRRRVTLKIVFVWLLSIAMSLPLSLMYSKDQGSLIMDGTCQIPDPLYKLIGSIISFYIPLLVMLVTYWLTVRLLARQQKNLGAPNWSSNWMGGPANTAFDRRCTWRRLLNATKAKNANNHCAISKNSTPQHAYSAASTDTEVTTIDTHELWIQESEPTPCAVSALSAFGAEMLKLSRSLEAASKAMANSKKNPDITLNSNMLEVGSDRPASRNLTLSNSSLHNSTEVVQWPLKRRRASTFHEGDTRDEQPVRKLPRKRGYSLYELPKFGAEEEIPTTYRQDLCENSSFPLPPPCTCPYFGENRNDKSPTPKPTEIKIVPSDKLNPAGRFLLDPNKPVIMTPMLSPSKRSLKVSPKSSSDSSPINVIVTWEPSKRTHRRGSSFGQIRTSAYSSPRTPTSLRRSATLRHNGNSLGLKDRNKNPSSPCLSQKFGSYTSQQPQPMNNRSIRSHHSRNSSVISRNSSRHGRIIRLEQKATKVLGVVFFTFVILWAPFFILNLLPAFCEECEKNLDNWVFQLVTWLGYASSMVNPIFYTIFNKVFRQAFKKVLTCRYRKTAWRPHR